MNPELPPQEEQQENLAESYINPEVIDLNTLEILLKEGEVQNIRPIEEHRQQVPPHADRVLLGDMNSHADQLFEGEIPVPESPKKLLVVYKPESGINHGTARGKEIPLPKESSPYENKEIAAWIVAKNLNLKYLSFPATKRELKEGEGSVRPYIWGEPLELLSEEDTEAAESNREILEDIALYDYLIQNIDRSPSNLIWNKDSGSLKVIDHSLTFFSEEYVERWHIKGPRLKIAYDTNERLKAIPLPNRLLEKIEQFQANKPEIRQNLSELLTEREINGIFKRTEKLVERKIFL